MTKITYDQTQKFTSEFKKLSKKFPSLKTDLETAQQYSIEPFHSNKEDNKGIFKIDGVKNDETLQFFKLKKFACKALKGRGSNTGIRIIYAFFPVKNEIVFLEIYFKADKENEDRGRIEEFRNYFNI